MKKFLLLLAILISITISLLTACKEPSFKLKFSWVDSDESVQSAEIDSEKDIDAEDELSTDDESAQYDNVENDYDYYPAAVEITPPEVSPAPQDYYRGQLLLDGGFVDIYSFVVEEAWDYYTNYISLNCEITGANLISDLDFFELGIKCYDTNGFVLSVENSSFKAGGFREPFRYSFTIDVPKETTRVAVNNLIIYIDQNTILTY